MAKINFDQFSSIIDGQNVTSSTTRHGINPATMEPLAAVPVCTSADVDAAVAAAKRAVVTWGKTPAHERQQALLKFAEAFAEHSSEFAKMLVLEVGKPMSMAEIEIAQTVGILKGIASLPFPEDVIEDSSTRRVITRYVPVVPVVLTSFKLGPAIVAGSPIILKPSPFTPYCGLKIAELANQFFPPGVVQALSGDDGLGPLLTNHPGVDKVSFTGSTATGMKVMKDCSKTLKRVTLELGGNDAAIVCEDVDIPTVAAKVTALALYNSGQVCIAIKRVYVHESIYKEFLAEMAKFAESMVVGNGLEEKTTMGPVQNSMQYERVQNLIAQLEKEQLKTATGSLKSSTSTKGFFINPIIIENPPEDSKIVVEEPFGPVFPVMRWSNEEDVLKRVNDTVYGLGASVWSRNEEQADRLAKQIEAGNVWVNTHMELRPDAAFGGHKFSGIGSELGMTGLKAFCNTQTIHWNKE
ncbi:hypothetical protein FZEAL_3757 [Fusarium zealandicum]|uniref:aldehyde dehydrogenase (NAD(+)) n=1 Tax=Fusarium zealandicum TaxID=1053134 RepID=A0A8H4UNV3_9HYPO|nr:hypothetical protein FZEAL_3757 [Fusarium zealandicum]